LVKKVNFSLDPKLDPELSVKSDPESNPKLPVKSDPELDPELPVKSDPDLKGIFSDPTDLSKVCEVPRPASTETS